MDVEKQESDRVIQERLSKWSLKRLQDEGYCLAPLSGFWTKGALSRDGKRIAALTTDVGKELGFHRFT